VKAFPHAEADSACALARWENEGGAIYSAGDHKKASTQDRDIWRKQFARLVRAIGFSRPGRRRRTNIQ
jgi:hypothetical protein